MDFSFFLLPISLASISANKEEEHAFTDASPDYLKRGWPHFGGDQGEGGGVIALEGRSGRKGEGWKKNLKLHRLSEEMDIAERARRGCRPATDAFNDFLGSRGSARGGPTPRCGIDP